MLGKSAMTFGQFSNKESKGAFLNPTNELIFVWFMN
jgi:hypothetical protein